MLEKEKHGKNKVYAILVICGSIVVAIWLLQRQVAIPIALQNQNATVSVGQNLDTNTATSTDWQKILVAADPNVQTTSVVPIDNSSAFDDTTLTAQMAKDFFGQYLNVANNGEISTDDADNIAQNVLASPEYTTSTGPVYIAANLKVNQNTDTATIKSYNQTLVTDLQSKTSAISTDPVEIVGDALQNSDPTEMAKLDPIITERQGVISDLLQMEVPADAVTVHLALLNAYSNVLANLEAMQTALTDPVRAFAGANAYAQDITDLQTALTNINTYFVQKLAPKTQ